MVNSWPSSSLQRTRISWEKSSSEYSLSSSVCRFLLTIECTIIGSRCGFVESDAALSLSTYPLNTTFTRTTPFRDISKRNLFDINLYLRTYLYMAQFVGFSLFCCLVAALSWNSGTLGDPIISLECKAIKFYTYPVPWRFPPPNVGLLYTIRDQYHTRTNSPWLIVERDSDNTSDTDAIASNVSVACDGLHGVFR